MTHSFDQARRLFLEGVAHCDDGRLDAAARCFEASLVLVPGRVSTLVNLGVARLGLMQPEAALQALGAAVATEPGRSDAWWHRGAAHSLLGLDVEALADFDRSLALEAEAVALHFDRALTLNRLGRFADALTALQALPDDLWSEARAQLLNAQILENLGRADEALLAYQRAAELDPASGLAWSLRGHLLRHMGRLPEAGAAYERAASAGYNVDANRFYLGATGTTTALTTAPTSYVRGLFDDYAARFDVSLVQGLKYRGHVAVVEMIPIKLYASVLDLGCGTGLAGPLLRPLAQRLVGIDLSPKMLEMASRTGLYDELLEAELTQHLRDSDQRHDLIVCCDVLGYLGDLGSVFSGVRAALKPGGRFGFSVEVSADGAGFQLQPSLRYAHSEAYLRQVAADHGLEVLRVDRGLLRFDRGTPIKGLFLHLTASHCDRKLPDQA